MGGYGPMKPNISQMKDFLKCPQLAYNAHVMRRGPVDKPVVLEEGTLFHEAMALRLQGATSFPPQDNLPSWMDVSGMARESFTKHKLWLPAENFTILPDWEVAAVEV